jgi:hypothetical protein
MVLKVKYSYEILCCSTYPFDSMIYIDLRPAYLQNYIDITMHVVPHDALSFSYIYMLFLFFFLPLCRTTYWSERTIFLLSLSRIARTTVVVFIL